MLGELCFSRELGSTVGGMNNALKVKDYLNAGRLFYPHWDEAYAQKLITQFKLAPKKRISALSKGMASMLTIVLALASRAGGFLPPAAGRLRRDRAHVRYLHPHFGGSLERV